MADWKRAFAVMALLLSPGAVSAGEDVLLLHSDGSYEWGYGWDGNGCAAPDWGAFAETYAGCWSVSAIVLDITAIDSYYNGCDLYVWRDDGGTPGEVLHVETDVFPYLVPLWPAIGRNTLNLSLPVAVDGDWWIGFWGAWPMSTPGFFIGADFDGPGGGCPMTKIAPGQGYPEGWQHVSVPWEPTAALGIGAEVEACPPSPVVPATWGTIKALYVGRSTARIP